MAFSPPTSSSPQQATPNTLLPITSSSSAFSPLYVVPEFVVSPLDTGLNEYPLFDYPFTPQVTANLLSNELFACMDGVQRLSDGFAWESNDGTLTTPGILASWEGHSPRRNSLTGSDFGSLNPYHHPSTNPFGQLPEMMIAPAAAPDPNAPRPKPRKRSSNFSTASKAKIEEEKDARGGKKERNKDKGGGKSTRKKSSATSQRPPSGPLTVASGGLGIMPQGKRPKPATRTNSTQSLSQGGKRPIPQSELDGDGDGDDQAAWGGEGDISDEDAEIGIFEDDIGVDVDMDSDDDNRPKRATQRNRNRLAATKCRAKAKAAITQLEEVNQVISYSNDSLHAQVAALRSQVVDLRAQLLQHGDCDCTPIQKYLQNAAELIGDSGGRHPILGPDGRGGDWTEYYASTSGP